MDPSPQSALPLPPRPHREWYHKLAKELVRACADADPAAVETWCRRWLRSLATERERPGILEIRDLAGFAQRVVRPNPGGKRSGLLARAQYVVARAHGFDSWPRFVHHLAALAAETSPEARFETAVEAIVRGHLTPLRGLLEAHPELIRARSTRQHGATLLHYVAANGVESYRQKTPANIVAITTLLLDAGAEVDATASVYGGHHTTLGLAATSLHPERAGVQDALLALLLERGARLDFPHPPPAHSLVDSCLANGRLRAAEFLLRRGAPLDLSAAAGMGELERVRSLLDDTVASVTDSGTDAGSRTDLTRAVCFAASYGRADVLTFLIDRGFDLAMQDDFGHTAAHCAALGGQTSTLRVLLARGVPLELRSIYGGTVLGAALWSAAHGVEARTAIDILQLLVGAGAELPERHPPINTAVDAWLAARGCLADPSQRWSGEDLEAGG